MLHVVFFGKNFGLNLFFENVYNTGRPAAKECELAC
jgi:hypothetical protein